MRINVGDRGVDFYGAYPPPTTLADLGYRYIGIYTKWWKPDYVTACHNLGIGVYAIGERAQGNALYGAAQGTIDALLFVQQAQANKYPTGNVIVVCHDVSTNTPAVGLYFKAAEGVVRRAGYLFGGYLSSDAVNICVAAGCMFDLIVAPGASGWGGGAHVDSHIKQYPQNVTNVPGYLTDLNVARREFDVWAGDTPAPPIETAPTPAPEEEDDMNVVTNSEPGLADPGKIKFLVTSSGKLRHLGYTEWVARGSDEGVPLSNAQISELGTV